MKITKWGIKPRLGSLWVGAHWSGLNKRLCVNLVPCLTVWLVFEGGRGPDDPLPVVYTGDTVYGH